MLSNLTIAIFLGAGSGAWLYAKMMHYSGNNRKNAVVVAAVSSIIIMLIFTAILDAAFKKN